MIRARLDRLRDDEGMTMIELIITSTILVVVLGMVFVSMSLINDVSSNVSSQYEEFDQALPALTPFHSLLAAEMEPGPQTVGGIPTAQGLPTSSSVPDPGFASIGNFATTFYANVGTNYSNTLACPSGQSCTTGGSSAGPAQIVAEELDQSGHPVASGVSTCTSADPCSFQVRAYLPETGLSGTQGAPSCPILWGSSITLTSECQYSPTDYRLVADVQDVVNDPSALDCPVLTGINCINSGGGPTQPIFTYTIYDEGGTFAGTPYNENAITLTPDEIESGTITLPNSDGYPSGTQSLSNCGAPSASYPTAAIACPADAIQAVGIDLMVAKPGSTSEGTVEDRLVVYRYAQSPGSITAPYQYSETQG